MLRTMTMIHADGVPENGGVFMTLSPEIFALGSRPGPGPQQDAVTVNQWGIDASAIWPLLRRSPQRGRPYINHAKRRIKTMAQPSSPFNQDFTFGEKSSSTSPNFRVL